MRVEISCSVILLIGFYIWLCSTDTLIFLWSCCVKVRTTLEGFVTFTVRRGMNILCVYVHIQANLRLGRARSELDGTRWRRGGEVKGKLANGVGSQYSHATSERGLCTITQADAHTSAASSWVNWRPHRFKWTRPFRGKTKSGFCACAIMLRTSYSMCLY